MKFKSLLYVTVCVKVRSILMSFNVIVNRFPIKFDKAYLLSDWSGFHRQFKKLHGHFNCFVAILPPVRFILPRGVPAICRNTNIRYLDIAVTHVVTFNMFKSIRQFYHAISKRTYLFAVLIFYVFVHLVLLLF